VNEEEILDFMFLETKVGFSLAYTDNIKSYYNVIFYVSSFNIFTTIDLVWFNWTNNNTDTYLNVEQIKQLYSLLFP